MDSVKILLLCQLVSTVGSIQIFNFNHIYLKSHTPRSNII